jgi:hypothetical protein
MLNAMMEKASLFCGTPAREVRDTITDYFAP